jgi:hypothetical protein
MLDGVLELKDPEESDGKKYFEFTKRWFDGSGLQNSYRHISWPMVLAGKIQKGKVTSIAHPQTCRENFIGGIRRILFAPPEVREYVNYQPVQVSNPLFLRKPEISNQSNFIVGTSYEYPRSKEIREKNEQLKTDFISSIEVAKRILHYLEELAGWKGRTKVYECKQNKFFPRGNYGIFCFSGPKNWWDSTYLASLFLLICRLSRNPFLKESKASNVEEITREMNEIRKKIEDGLKDKYSTWWLYHSIGSDALMTLKTSWTWEPFVQNFKAINGKRTRNQAMAFQNKDQPYGQNLEGILKIATGEIMDDVIKKRYSDVIRANEPEWSKKMKNPHKVMGK